MEISIFFRAPVDQLVKLRAAPADLLLVTQGAPRAFGIDLARVPGSP
jgi:hypothetical protein